MKRFVLDASAVIAFFADRPGAVRVEDLLRQAAEGQHQLYLSVVDWGEVYASIWRARGQPAADQKLAELSQLPIEVVDVDMPTAQLAARLQAEHNLPYAACFAGALAIERKAVLVTEDHGFQRVQKLVNVLWLTET